MPRYFVNTAILVSWFLVGCKENSKDEAVLPTVGKDDVVERPMIRSIRFYGTEDDYGVELNGDRAVLWDESAEEERKEIPYRDGLALLEDFYAITGIENFRGTSNDDRQTSKQFLVNIFDEEPQYYSEEWVDYIFDRDGVQSGTEIGDWFDRMASLRESTN